MDKVEGTTDDNRWHQARRADATLHLVSRLVKAGIVEKAKWESQGEIKNTSQGQQQGPSKDVYGDEIREVEAGPVLGTWWGTVKQTYTE